MAPYQDRLVNGWGNTLLGNRTSQAVGTLAHILDWMRLNRASSQQFPLIWAWTLYAQIILRRNKSMNRMTRNYKSKSGYQCAQQDETETPRAASLCIQQCGRRFRWKGIWKGKDEHSFGLVGIRIVKTTVNSQNSWKQVSCICAVFTEVSFTTALRWKQSKCLSIHK